MAIDEPIKRKRSGTPAGDSLPAETKMGRKMAVVHRRLSLLGNGGKHVDNDDGFESKDEKLATVVGQQAKAVDDCDDPAEKVKFVPLRIMRPTSEENGQERRPGLRYKHGTRKPKAYKRKSEWQVGSKSSKSKKEEKLTLSLHTSVGSNTPEEESADEDVNSWEDPKVTPLSTNSFGGDTDFDAVKSFEDFNIALDDLVIDHELLPDRLRMTYYELCCTRKAFLHRHLVKHISPTLAAGVIAETAHISESIRASHASSSSLEDLADWKTTLHFLESMGMDVAFLRKRVDDLHVVVEEKLVAQEKMRALKSKMSSINDALKDISMEMEGIEESVAKMQKYLAVRKLATAPW